MPVDRCRPRQAWRALSLVLLWFAIALPTGAAWETASLDGADVRSLAIAPADPDLVFAGTSSGQIFRSSDAGQLWSEPGDRIAFPGWIVSDLVFDPNQPGRLWAALWGLWGGGLVAYSDDLGIVWHVASDGLPETQVYTLAPVPGRTGHLYAGTRQGVFGSRDGGGSWKRLTAARPELQKVTSLLVDPADPDTVLAGTWRRAYRTHDAGATWNEIFDGMVLDSEVFTLNPVPGKPGELWASTCGWVYHGVGLGERWVRHTSGLEERRTPSFRVLENGSLLAGTVGGLYRSQNGGRDWARRTGSDLSILAIATHPARPGRVFLGTEGSGVWRSDDAGGAFVRASSGLTNVRISALSTLGGEMFAAVRYAGPESGLYSSVDGGRTFARIEAPDSLILDLGVLRGVLYAGTENGLFERRGGEWRAVTEAGDDRVEQVVVRGTELLVRTAERALRLRGGRFESVPYGYGPPRSGALYGDSVWLTDGEALHRIEGSEVTATSLPYAGARLTALGDRLVVAGHGGVWSRRWPEGPWETLVTESARVVETEDPRFPLVVIAAGEDTVQLYDAERGVLRRFKLPVPPTSVQDAAIFGQRLVVATSGYGVLSGPLPAPVRPAR